MGETRYALLSLAVPVCYTHNNVRKSTGEASSQGMPGSCLLPVWLSEVNRGAKAMQVAEEREEKEALHRGVKRLSRAQVNGNQDPPNPILDEPAAIWLLPRCKEGGDERGHNVL